ncbi:Ribulose-5-phosphate 4-epimerase/Fuculose-1-phosphate aldolase [Pseudonocardia oroxyli]|uniref:Ribulose-5-phosphate 4-epimerase/Fuculose-1-phosphate aldolase n=2 Tax=Pseudonocardia oroxyli TaxID=366584 RepID=A0A1G7TTD4_PSEOR|nr:Ribulose-5-phosphate 4-epimerase/Fuculose-1-phosphate aldolase [Pseudonocardia oroxyli]
MPAMTSAPPHTTLESSYAPLEGPGIGRELSPVQEFALFARMLSRLGYDDGLAGHITYQQADGTFLVNPFLIPWDQLRASDVCVCDSSGSQIAGRYRINSATELHFAFHRVRTARVIVHNHPKWSTAWSAMRRLPPVYDQSSALASGRLVLVDEYTGTVEQRQAAEQVIEAMGDAEMAILANHGVLIIADSLPELLTRARVLEVRSHNAWHVEAMGPGGRPLPDDMVTRLGQGLEKVGGAFPGYFESMARREISADPSVLD